MSTTEDKSHPLLKTRARSPLSTGARSLLRATEAKERLQLRTPWSMPTADDNRITSTTVYDRSLSTTEDMSMSTNENDMSISTTKDIMGTSTTEDNKIVSTSEYKRSMPLLRTTGARHY
ncbi:hypothetical protein DPMN_052959 [Dreissena polymorpha]|uniref:Uncharacterized protein n=1 Tax=Dreissena polymorpha TaxID=45954 RepID=A0A9D4CLU0_DREPO|nr:hypothetical protein DPMN_052959 [Dreissena polymorpha]